MRKRLVHQLREAQERHRLTLEYLQWAEMHHPVAVKRARRDLAQHEHEVAKLKRYLGLWQALLPWRGIRRASREIVPFLIFACAATLFTWIGRWDAGFVGLLNGTIATLMYLYFAKDTGYLRL